MDNAVIAALAGMLGAGLPILTKFALEFFNVKRKAQQDERAEVWQEASKLRQELADQILNLRTGMVKLQEDNLTKAIENTELKSKLKNLEREVDELKKELGVRDQEVSKLQVMRDNLDQARNELQTEITKQLANLAQEVRYLKEEFGTDKMAPLNKSVEGLQALSTASAGPGATQ